MESNFLIYNKHLTIQLEIIFSATARIIILVFFTKRNSSGVTSMSCTTYYFLTECAHSQIYLLSKQQMTAIQMENRHVIIKKHILLLVSPIYGSINQRTFFLNPYQQLIYKNMPYIINTLLAFRIAGKSKRKFEVNVKTAR